MRYGQCWLFAAVLTAGLVTPMSKKIAFDDRDVHETAWATPTVVLNLDTETTPVRSSQRQLYHIERDTSEDDIEVVDEGFTLDHADTSAVNATGDVTADDDDVERQRSDNDV